MLFSPCCKFLCFCCVLFKDDVVVFREAEIGDHFIYDVVFCSSDGRTVSFRAKLLDDALAFIQ